MTYGYIRVSSKRQEDGNSIEDQTQENDLLVVTQLDRFAGQQKRVWKPLTILEIKM